MGQEDVRRSDELANRSPLTPDHTSGELPQRVDVDCTASSTSGDLLLSGASLEQYLACVIPPPPSLSDPVDPADSLYSSSSTTSSGVVMDVDPASLIVPPPPVPVTLADNGHSGQTSPAGPARVAGCTSPAVSSKQAVPPPTKPKHTKKSGSDAAANTGIGTDTAAPRQRSDDVTLPRGGRDVTGSDDVTGSRGSASECLLNAVEFFPPPPPLDDWNLVTASSDNLPPPPPSVLQASGADWSVSDRAGLVSLGATTSVLQASGSVTTGTAAVRPKGTSDNAIKSPVSASSSKSDDELTSELAAVMLAARLRAEPNQPVTTGR